MAKLGTKTNQLDAQDSDRGVAESYASFCLNQWRKLFNLEESHTL